jgi:hypothetical protein
MSDESVIRLSCAKNLSGFGINGIAVRAQGLLSRAE